MKANPVSGSVFVAINVKNNSTENKSLDLTQFELVTISGLRNPPVSIIGDSVLTQGETRQFGLIFEPINNLKLYKLTDYKGDLQSHYKLVHNNTSIEFEIEPEDLPRTQEYKIEEKITVYQLLKTKDSSLESTENEVLKNGLVVKLKFFGIGDSIIGKLSIINHGEGQVSIEPESFFLNHGDRVFLPSEILHTGGSLYNDTLFLAKSERYTQRTSFVISEHPDTFGILASGIQDTKHTNVLMSLKFVKMN
jgi:hypothetical protein